MWESIISVRELHRAYKKASAAKRYKKSVLQFGYDLEYNIQALHTELTQHTYRPDPHTTFFIDDPKPRLIQAPAFRDRVVHHALCAHIAPVCERKFIEDSYACRARKGTHAAMRRVYAYAHHCSRGWREPAFFLKLDIARYFASIDHTILKRLVRRKIVDAQTLWLCDRVIDSNCSTICNGSRVGIPIGNLTSQLFANLYLHELDWFIKHQLRCRYYARYMDDMVLLHHNRQVLEYWNRAIRSYASDKLAISTHPHKTLIGSVYNGISFVGYRLMPGWRRVRAATLRRFIKRIKRGTAICPRSFFAHCSHANTTRLTERLLFMYQLDNDHQISNVSH